MTCPSLSATEQNQRPQSQALIGDASACSPMEGSPAAQHAPQQVRPRHWAAHQGSCSTCAVSPQHRRAPICSQKFMISSCRCSSFWRMPHEDNARNPVCGRKTPLVSNPDRLVTEALETGQWTSQEYPNIASATALSFPSASPRHGQQGDGLLLHSALVSVLT